MLVNQTTLPNGMLLKLLARLHILSYKIQIQENDWNWEKRNDWVNTEHLMFYPKTQWPAYGN